MPCNPIGATDRRINQYNKIVNLDNLTKELEKMVKADLNIVYNPTGDFEDVVDQEAAHPSLVKLMNCAESNFAKVVEALLAQGKELELVKEYIYQKGKEFALDDDNLEDAYNDIFKIVLDGMPCDETRVITVNEPNKLEWTLVDDLHSEYWKDPSYYFIFLKSYIHGLLSKTSIKYDYTNSKVFTLTK